MNGNTNSQNDSVKHRKKLEPFFHITKRAQLPLWQNILIRAGAIIAALVLCAIITIVMTHKNPIAIYTTIIKGAFGTPTITWMTIHNAAILLIISLAVAPAFKMKFWNTGAEGQVLAGALITAVLMYALGGKLPEPLLVLIIIFGSILAGALWGVIPAVFKAYFGTNETLFTLMMNYVAIQLIEFFINAVSGGSHTVGPKLLAHGWLPVIGGQSYLLNVLIVVLIAALMYVYLYYSKHGYEISVVGESRNTARYIGINVKKVIIRTMALSGSICGLTGLMLVAGTSHSINSNLAGGNGFTAIMVAWLAKFNPIMMVFASFLIVILNRGAGEVATIYGLNKSFSDILIGIILFFVIGCEFFINYNIRFNKKQRYTVAKEAE